MTIETLIFSNLRKNYSTLRHEGMQASWSQMAYKAANLSNVVSELHKETLALGSKAKMNARFVAQAMRCIDVDSESFGWGRNAKAMAFFNKFDREL
ncbi:MAG: hypothetical protein DRH37_11280 [Deltaproteobacteria bacterium]|nr:MAG: hypothetical protein DRH37_11280 [Deltaproteobacteria bacterium]